MVASTPSQPPPAHSTARALHAELLAVWSRRSRAEYAASKLLVRIDDHTAYAEVGPYRTLAEYADAHLDLNPRQTRELVQLGRVLPGLPQLDQAFADGTLGWTKAREIARVATADTDAEWVEAAMQVNSRQLEQMVSQSRIGDGPPGETEPSQGEARQRLVFHLDGPGADMVRDALALLKTQCGPDVDRGELLVALAQRVLHDADGADAPTTERFKLVIRQCATCGQAAGVDHEATDTLASMARCDAEVVDVRPGPDAGRRSRTIPARIRRLVFDRDGYRCSVPGCRCTLWLDVHHLQAFAAGGGHELDNLALVCPGHHRMVHDGVLAMERGPDGAMGCTFADGRSSACSPGGRHPAGEATATHVGQSPGAATPQVVPSTPSNRSIFDEEWWP